MILIIGVTGSGKGRLAFELAKAIGAEIISVDSMKVYRRMDIGTAKPPKEALAALKYHLINVVEPSEAFSVGHFLESAHRAVEQIKHRNKPVIAVGGTALYIKALLYGLFEGPGADEQIRTKLRQRAKTEGLNQLYEELSKIDPLAADRINPNDSRRIIRALEVYELTGKPISSLQQQWPEDRRQKTEDRGQRTENRGQKTEDRHRTSDFGLQTSDFRHQTSDIGLLTSHHWTIIGLRREKPEENKTLNARVKRMLAAGLVDEVKSLLAEDKPLSKQARCAIGYAELIDYLNGKTTLEEATELIKINSRRLAKSQRTWFKTFRNVNWLDIDAEEKPEKILNRTRTLLERAPQSTY